MNASAVNSAAAVAAALQEDVPGIPKRRSLNAKNAGSSRGFESSKHIGSNHDRYQLGETFVSDANTVVDNDTAVVDDFLSPETAGSASKAKTRRASEGAYLSKGEGKRSSGELRCEKCGKGYKHSSCLTKHLSVYSGPFVFQLLARLLPRPFISITLSIIPPLALLRSPIQRIPN